MSSGDVSCLRPDHQCLKLIRSGTAGPKTNKDGDCGEIKFVSVCPVAEHEKISKKYHSAHCNRLGCSVCMPSRAAKQAKQAEKYFSALILLYKERKSAMRDLRHVEWSVHPSKYDEVYFLKDGGKAFLNEFQKVFKSAVANNDEIIFKFYGGAYNLHLWRKKHVIDGSSCDFHPRRINGTLTRCPKGEHYWEWGPHVHYLGYGFFERSDLFEKRTGWVYKVIPENEDYSRSIFGTIFYWLTHCALFIDDSGKQRNQAVRWLGAFSKNKAEKRMIDNVDVPVICEVPDCGEQKLKFVNKEIDGKVERGGYLGLCHHKEKIYRYRLNGKRKKKDRIDNG